MKNKERIKRVSYNTFLELRFMDSVYFKPINEGIRFISYVYNGKIGINRLN